MSPCPPEKRDFARSLRRESTDAEDRLWEELRDRRLDGTKFRRQVPVPPYTADFLCAKAKLVIEVDGSQHGGAYSIRPARGFSMPRGSGSCGSGMTRCCTRWTPSATRSSPLCAIRRCSRGGKGAVPSPLVGEGAPKGRMRGVGRSGALQEGALSALCLAPSHSVRPSAMAPGVRTLGRSIGPSDSPLANRSLTPSSNLALAALGSATFSHKGTRTARAGQRTIAILTAALKLCRHPSALPLALLSRIVAGVCGAQHTTRQIGSRLVR